MKKLLTLFLILLLPSLSLAEGYYTLEALRENDGGLRWQADYNTVRNETIHVDTMISLPNADSIGVWDAEYRKPIQGYSTDNPQEQISTDVGWFSCTWPDSVTLKQIIQQAEQAGLQGIYAEPAPLVLQYGQFDLNTPYSINNVLTVQEVWDFMEASANRFFAGENIHVSPHLVHAHINPGEYKYNSSLGNYELVKEIPGFMGVLFVTFDQTVNGVPILALDANQDSYSGWAIMQSMADYGLDTYSYHLAYRPITPIGQSRQNVSICPPEKIIHNAELLIQEGKLRSVYCLRLGYAARSKGKGSMQLIPVWVIEGELFKDARAEYKNRQTILSVDSLEQTKLIFDAQTGELIETCRMQYQ